MANVRTGGQPFEEQLAQLMGQLGQTMAAPDADMGFLMALQQAIKMRLVQQVPPLGGPTDPNAVGPDATGFGAAGPRTPAGSPGFAGPQPAGLRREPSIPPGAASDLQNADEMRRVLALQGKM